MLQVSEVADDFGTVTPLAFNRYSLTCNNSALAAKHCITIHYSLFRFKSITKYFARGILFSLGAPITQWVKRLPTDLAD